jgi:hypothetical protein
VYAPSEIGQFDLTVDAHKQVLGFDIPVDDVLSVEV